MWSYRQGLMFNFHILLFFILQAFTTANKYHKRKVSFLLIMLNLVIVLNYVYPLNNNTCQGFRRENKRVQDA